ncbi:MAG: alpha/beta hydrolase family protein [Pseudomarimonas sp.]
MNLFRFALAPFVILSLLLNSAVEAAVIDPTPFLKQDTFGTFKVSPGGQYFAASVPLEDRTLLVVLNAKDQSVTAKISLGPAKHVEDFWWANDERVVLSISERFGQRDLPKLTGELMGIDADGSRADILVGFRARQSGTFTRLEKKKGDRVTAFMVDSLPQDERNILIATQPFIDDPFRKVERMDVYSGGRKTIGVAPIRNAEFFTDNSGAVRLVTGFNADRINHLYHRADDDAEWTDITRKGDEASVETPIGFSADNRLAYLNSTRAAGPDVIIELDLATSKRRIVLSDPISDPQEIIYRTGTNIPVGASFMGQRFHTAFFDDTAPEAKLTRSLEKAFAGQAVQITSLSADGGLALVRVWSDRSPGDYYTFDTKTLQAAHFITSRSWLDPELMGATQAIQLVARDGTPLHGYVTRPHSAAAGQLPMIVMPHGGPFDIYDSWGFDPEVQLLAAAGYAVLQVNFRGSGNYGKAFSDAGKQQWGRAMQDDVTDATRWTIEQGIADPQRICLHGASYGGYASLMGVAREPSLYRCASGYIGVYDLAKMHSRGDIRESASGETYLSEWIGEPETLAEVSPPNLAANIKAPVFLAAGGEDRRAPIAHSKQMETALRAAGVPVETLYFDNEGHGFYLEDHRLTYYKQLLAFLDRHIGQPSQAAAATSDSNSSK